MNIEVPEWQTVYGGPDDWFEVADVADDGSSSSTWLKGQHPSRTGWLRSEVYGVIGGWVVMFLAGYATLWAFTTDHLALGLLCAFVMFVAACIASEGVPDATTSKDTVRLAEAYFRHAFADQGWDRAKMNYETARWLAKLNPRYVKGGTPAIRKRVGQLQRRG